LFLVLRRAPAAVDVKLDVVLRGIRRGPAEGTQETWIKAGDGRVLVIEDGHTVRDDTVSFSKSHRWDPVVASIVAGLPRGFCRGSLVGLDALDGGREVAGKLVDG
jgi:hypothetical protein